MSAETQQPLPANNDPDSEFRAFIYQTLGIHAPPIKWGASQPQRFPGRDKKPPNDSGWVVGFADQRGGVFGDHSQGTPEKGIPWQAERQEPPTAEDRAEWKRKSAKRAAERAKAAERAQDEARAAWDAAVPAKCSHPYLKGKRITRNVGELRVLKAGTDGLFLMRKPLVVQEDTLLVPMMQSKKVVGSVQRITASGKRYWPGAPVKGLFLILGKEHFKPDVPIYVCEGWATGWSISGCAKAPCIVAFSDDGLLPIAKRIRDKYEGLRIIVAADNDRWSELKGVGPNPGVLRARAAAAEVNAGVAIPDFKDLSTKPTDFNDLHRLEGPRAVQRWLDPGRSDKAVTVKAPEAPEPEPEPEPEDTQTEPEPGPEPAAPIDPAESILTADLPGPADRIIAPAGKTWRGFGEALDQLGISMRWNNRAGDEEWRERDAPWQALNDRSMSRIWTTIAERCVYLNREYKAFPLKFSIAGRVDALSSYLFDKEVDPFRLYLESLPVDQVMPDDGVSIFTLLHDLLGAEDTPLARWGSVYLFLGAVQRTFDPGCKLDEILVLIGPGGIGKSSILREAVPDPEYFSDGLSLHDLPKQQVEAMAGRVIVEIAEMSGYSVADKERLKAFISRQNDGAIRMAYARRTEPRPRRCIFVGTADREQVLPNDRNLRRFVPVPCHSGSNIEAFMAKHRDRLWTEAVQLYREGMRANLPRSLYPVQREVAEQHRQTDPVEEIIEAIESGIAVNGWRETGTTLVDIGKECRIEVVSNTADGKRLAEALRIRGWNKRQKRVDGKRVKRWFPPS